MPTLHFERQSVYFLLKPTSIFSSSACFFHILFGLHFFLWPSTSISNALLKKWPSSLLNTWPYQWILFAIGNWSIVSFKHSMNIKAEDLFLSFSCTPHIALTMDLSILSSNSHLTFFQTPCFTTIQYCWPCLTPISSPFQLERKPPAMQQLTTLTRPNSCTSCSGSYSSLTSSTCSHPVTEICEFTYSFHFISCSTASPIFPSHFLHVKCLDNFGVSIFIPAHLPWIHLPHCRHKIELASTLKLQTPYVSALLLDMSPFVMPPQDFSNPCSQKPPSILGTYSRVLRLSHKSGLSHQHAAINLA